MNTDSNEKSFRLNLLILPTIFLCSFSSSCSLFELWSRRDGKGCVVRGEGGERLECTRHRFVALKNVLLEVCVAESARALLCVTLAVAPCLYLHVEEGANMC